MVFCIRYLLSLLTEIVGSRKVRTAVVILYEAKPQGKVSDDHKALDEVIQMMKQLVERWR